MSAKLSYFGAAIIGAAVTSAVLIFGALRVPEVGQYDLLQFLVTGVVGGAIGGLLFRALRAWRTAAGNAGIYGSWMLASTACLLTGGSLAYCFFDNAVMLRETLIYGVPLGLLVGASIATIVVIVTNRF